jgi:hypothetical protein
LDNYVFPEDAVYIIKNFWECLAYLNYKTEDFAEFIKNILNEYSQPNMILEDKQLFQRPAADPQSETERAIDRIKETTRKDYNVPLEYRTECSCDEEDCDECHKRCHGVSCHGGCNMKLKFRYENYCLACKQRKAVAEYNNRLKEDNEQRHLCDKHPRHRIEAWICSTHKMSLFGRPRLHVVILKTEQKNSRKVHTTITKTLHDLTGGHCNIEIKNNSSAKRPVVNAIGFAWKNVENVFCYDQMTRASESIHPLARTVFTSAGRCTYDSFYTIVEKYRSNPSVHNPCTTLETEFLLSEPVQPPTDSISIEKNPNIKAVGVLIDLLKQENMAINIDGTVWKKVANTKKILT